MTKTSSTETETAAARTIYHVTDTDLNSETREFLVRAESAAVAKNHIRRLLTAKPASQDVLVRMLGGGAEVETAE